MRTKTILTLCSCWSVLALTGCDTKDPIHNTTHPDYGTITLTTKWHAYGLNLTPPADHVVTVGDYSTTLNGATNKLDHLFEPGKYNICIYNTAEYLTVNGTTITVDPDPDNADKTEPYIQRYFEFIAAISDEILIEKDKDHALNYELRELTRELIILLDPTGDSANRIKSIKGYFSGAAGKLDFADGTHSSPSYIELDFQKYKEGENAGKWWAIARLLGTAGTQQTLNVQINFEDDNPKPIPLHSDLTQELASFNAEKGESLTLGSKLVVTPSNMGFTATLNNWKVDDKETGTAE